MRPPEFIVGIDGSPESSRALAWAGSAAAQRGSPLLVLNAYDWSAVAAGTPMGAPFLAEVKENAEALVADAVAAVRAKVPGLKVRGEAVLGDAARTLVRASAQGATVVVGNRGRGGVSSLLLGSVSQHVALHAHGSVVVVRGRSDADHGPVVVGVNGSSESQAALLQAFEEAISRHTGVLAVHADMSGAAYWLDAPGYVEAPQERREAQTAALVAEVSPWAEKFPDVPTRCVAIEGHPAHVLTEQSATARLVVVGNRVHNGISGMLLGSVGLHLLHHAQCPVLLARSALR